MLEVVSTKLPPIEYHPKSVDESPKVNQYPNNNYVRIVTKLPQYYYKTTNVYPKIEREQTRKVEYNDVIEDAPTTSITFANKNLKSVATNAKEILRPKNKIRSKGDYLRASALCELILILRPLWVLLFS